MKKLSTILETAIYPAESMRLIDANTPISENLKYHLDKNLSLEECVFRHYSDAYFQLIDEVRNLYHANKIELNDFDADIVESDLGKTAIYEGVEIFLDAPLAYEDEFLLQEAMHQGKTVKLNKPFRTPGGPKKFAVYVKTKAGKIKKVTFGDPNMKIRASSDARRKSFAARHKCNQKKDKTTAGYWSCRSHRIKSLGTKSKGKYW